MKVSVQSQSEDLTKSEPELMQMIDSPYVMKVEEIYEHHR